MELDLVAMVPDIPRNLPQFHDERSSPTFASVASAQPDEVSFLNTCPFDCDAAFEESQPSYAILCVDRFE
jgi:hypothetical protein